MNLNATLFAQLIVFLVLITFTAKFIWPPLMEALDKRRKQIEDGLAAAEKSRVESESLQRDIERTRAELKNEAAQKREEMERLATMSADEIRQRAQSEYDRIVSQARKDAELEMQKAREALRDNVAQLAVKGAEQIIRREINPEVHRDLLEQLKAEL